ncbi:MAG: hypothetical protein GWO07_08380 [Candidatus Dadabacteria bacterium]|nr:hypothetical protein [Candidatus Dadabacteria bacterium]NIS08762.1 hypothetical protein [Candidatus Dadabacteria bacterium]NIV42705.1 hypothetical protein [Candidatus Dadabacteria bacterium]NIX15448.1 hypothetical protein [Candidatus Dadabacteria bacterium]NIY22110.1 hypothetical protein [Candidatus Dadabacteria bacterium]
MALEDSELIKRVDTELNMKNDIEDIYATSADILLQLENINMVMVYIVDPSSDQAVIVSHKNVPDSYLARAARIDRPRGITWKLIVENDILNIKNSQTDETIGPAGKALDKKGVYGVPIALSGGSKEARGVIWLWSNDEISFDSDQHRLALYVAQKVGLAITWSEKYAEKREEWKNKFKVETQ